MTNTAVRERAHRLRRTRIICTEISISANYADVCPLHFEGGTGREWWRQRVRERTNGSRASRACSARSFALRLSRRTRFIEKLVEKFSPYFFKIINALRKIPRFSEQELVCCLMIC